MVTDYMRNIEFWHWTFISFWDTIGNVDIMSQYYFKAMALNDHPCLGPFVYG